MKKLKRKNKGITLIALVITIIILLILAGVAIASLGENGLLARAKEAKQVQIEAEMKENLELAIQELQIEKLGGATLDDITEDWLKEKMPEDYEIIALEDDPTTGGKKVVLKKDGVKGTFIIDENLNITKIENKDGSLDFTYEVGERDGEAVKITIKMQDEERGISKIEIPNKEAIIPDETKGEITIEHDVQLGEECTIMITLANGEIKEKTILINEYYHKITKNFSEGIKINNTAVKAAYNQPYQATITVEGDYVIDTLTVTMGGEAVTVDKTTGVINIEKVTGDIEITATAKIVEITVTEPIIATTTTATSSVADNSQKDGTELYINFSATIGENACTVTPEVPYKITTSGTYKFTITGTYNGKTLTKEISVEANKYQIYEIRTPEDLQNMGNDMSGTYRVMNDIDMADFEFTSIRGGYFTGKLDGQGYTISNLTITGDGRASIFESVKNAAFENILFKDVNMSSSSYSAAVLSNSVSEKINIKKVGITGNLSGTMSIGSFVGNNLGGGQIIFENCYARTTLNASASSYDTGGFVGNQYSDIVTIDKCYWSGTTNTTGRTGPFRGGGTIYNNDNQYTVGITVTNSFYNKELFTLSVPASVSGTGIATSQFKDSSNFTNWDFKENESDTEYTWYIDESGFPELHFDN